MLRHSNNPFSPLSRIEQRLNFDDLWRRLCLRLIWVFLRIRVLGQRKIGACYLWNTAMSAANAWADPCSNATYGSEGSVELERARMSILGEKRLRIDNIRFSSGCFFGTLHEIARPARSAAASAVPECNELY